MAYMNFAEFEGATALAEQPHPVQTGFTALEWSVIAVARQDSLKSLKEPSRMATALGTLFGTWRDARLADRRLEALRRMAVLAWHMSYVVPVSELRAFFAAGFSTEQYETLQASVSLGRAQKRARRA